MVFYEMLELFEDGVVFEEVESIEDKRLQTSLTIAYDRDALGEGFECGEAE